MTEPYSFRNDKEADVRSLILMIASHGDDLVGAEIGVFTGRSFCTLLDNCPNIKLLHGVDSFEPYDDYLIPDAYQSSEPGLIFDRKQIDMIKYTFYHHVEYSAQKHKVRFHEMDTNEAAEYIDDESLDFIFLDAYLTGKQADNDLEVWYPKVKYGGIFAGHDWHCKDIEVAVNNFRARNNITKTMGTYDNTWVWMK